MPEPATTTEYQDGLQKVIVESLQKVIVESLLRRHRFRQANGDVWVRGSRRGRRFVARIDMSSRVIDFSGRRATKQVALDAPSAEVEQAMRDVLDA